MLCGGRGRFRLRLQGRYYLTLLAALLHARCPISFVPLIVAQALVNEIFPVLGRNQTSQF